MSSMTPLSKMSLETAARIGAVFTDIDDTLTSDGRLPAEAFSALWALHDAGVAVVPVTGRPAGWCDHFARMWPVAGVIGENGAFYFRYLERERRMRARFMLGPRARAHLQERLARVGQEILRKIPGTRLASDQPYRIHDLAIDYAEDVKPLSSKAVARIVELFEASGATAKVSSIHVNGWFGRYDKLGMIRRFAREVLTLDLDNPKDHRHAAYAGDSPNDEPAFRYFALSVGVANVRRFTSTLEYPPAFVTRREGGAGFAELARRILLAREAVASTRARRKTGLKKDRASPVSRPKPRVP